MNLDFLAKPGKSLSLLRVMSSDEDVRNVIDVVKVCELLNNPRTTHLTLMALTVIETQLGGALPFELENARKNALNL